MRSIILLTGLILIGTNVLFAQTENLVYNPSFEDYLKCPEQHTYMDYSHKLIPHWTYPTIATPDYFNRCSKGVIVDVPKNFAGTSEPVSGNAYMGAILTGSEVGYREYIQGELKKRLTPGVQYCVTFYYKLASDSKFAVDQLSMYFSEKEIKTEYKKHIPVKPQINTKPGLFIDNKGEWEQFCTVFIAEGNEKFFTIGNFLSYEKTNYAVTDRYAKNARDKSYAYYYFDDFKVIPVVDCNECPCVKHGMEVTVVDSSYTGGFDPLTGKIISHKKNDGRISLAVNGGTPPYSINWNIGSSALKLNNLPAGSYSYKVSDQFNCIEKGTITFVAPEVPVDDMSGGLDDIEEGAAIVLENIFFETNKTELLPESYAELDKVVSFMIRNSIKQIEISGHTDDQGSDAYNQKLSEGRAKSVIDYLIIQGINPITLSYVGYGESKPIDTNLTEEGRSQNRRVEFFLVKK